MRRYRRANQRRVGPKTVGRKNRDSEDEDDADGARYTQLGLVTDSRREGERRYGDEGSAQDEGVMDAGYGGS
jgi:hypothetical protein